MLSAQMSVLPIVFVLDGDVTRHVRICQYMLASYILDDSVFFIIRTFKKGTILTILFYVHGKLNIRMLVVEEV